MSQRNYWTNLTIISGDLDGDDTSCCVVPSKRRVYGGARAPERGAGQGGGESRTSLTPGGAKVLDPTRPSRIG